MSERMTQHIYLAQGEDFDTTYAFENEEARDLFALAKGYETTGEEVICDMAFAKQTAYEELPDSDLGVYLQERGVDLDALTHDQAADVWQWWQRLDPNAEVENWDTVHGPALDAKAAELRGEA